MSIESYNGGAVLAMAGKECLAVVCDKRLGARLTTIGMNHSKIYEINPYLYVCLPGLATDALTVYQRLRFRVNMYELKEGRKISAQVLCSMLSNLLYEHRFGNYFIGGVVAGLDPATGKTYLYSLDCIGAVSNGYQGFAIGGHCVEQLYGTCETLYRPDLGPEELFEVASQAFLSACDRDAGSGWGAFVYIVTKHKVELKSLKARMD